MKIILASKSSFRKRALEILGRKYTVTFRKLGEREIQDYVRRYPVVHCSAAMEGDALMRFARSVRGDYPFLTGIPMAPLIMFLRKNGVNV